LNSKYASTIISLTILVILSLIITVQVKANSTTVYVEPSLTSIEFSQTCQINISISQVIDLAGWEFKLYYPNSILNATSIEEGPFLKSAGSTLYLNLSFTDNYNATHGLIWAACSLQGSGPGTNGNGTLATITFKAKYAGNANLTLADTDLVDSQMPPNHIPHSTIGGMIRVVWGLHDIAITNVTSLKTVVGQNCTTNVSVTVENQGACTETFNLTLYASRPDVGVVNINLYGASHSIKNGWGFTQDTITSPGPTIIVKKGDIINLTLTSFDHLLHNFFVDYNGNKIPDTGEPLSRDFGEAFPDTINYKFIADKTGKFKYYSWYDVDIMYGNFTVIDPEILTIEISSKEITLNGGELTTLTFTWNTTGFSKGNYTIWAYAWPVLGETDTADNTFTDGTIYVSLVGDVNVDGKVDMMDIGWICLAYGSYPGCPNWNPNMDINNDNKVDMIDIGFACIHYGETDPDP